MTTHRLTRILLGLEVLALGGCVSPLYSAEPGAFHARSRLIIVSFDAYDWTIPMSPAPNPSASWTLDAAHRGFLADLGRADFEARDLQVTAPCKGDLGDLCKRLSVPGLSPVNLSTTVAQSVGASMPAGLLVEVHLLPDFHRDSFWSATAGSDTRETPALFVRAFDAKGKQVWEDQEMLELPLTFSKDAYWNNFNNAVQAAASNVVARLADHTRPGAR